MKEVKVTTEFIKLDQFLKYENIIESGGFAKQVIKDGLVSVNNEICTMRGKKLRIGDVVEFEGNEFKII